METETAPQRKPERVCDLVMKGGITSGIAYPEAIGALKDSYRFRNIGGASAGAIAAAATAAAEYGRESGGFETLTHLAEQLATNNGLQSLFQPTRAARPVFNLLLRLQLQRKDDRMAPGIGRVLTAIWAVASVLWWWPLSGAAAGALLVWAVNGGAMPFSPWYRVVALTIVLLVGAAVGLVVGSALRAWSLATKRLPESMYGLCTGMTEGDTGTPALTPWLHTQLQRMAGRNDDGKPITFTDLRSVEVPVEIDEKAGDVPGVRLQMMTTDLTLARPMRLPLTGDTQYYFSPDEFRKLFPSEVVEYLCREDVSEPSTAIVLDTPPEHLPSELRTLPQEDLPILVATRMSLSFPVLLSAVPLYTHRPTGKHHWVRHWLSDGGIGSNFPIHFFDSLVPRWPTFGLQFVSARVGEQNDVTPNDDSRLRPESQPMPRRGEIGSLGALLAAILDTMQNWRDTLQSELPGFRDRIEDIPLAKGEGGMNIAMDADTIKRVRAKGMAAGDRLAQGFRWDSHRFLRYAMTMRLLDEALGRNRLARGYRFDGFDRTISNDICAIGNELRATGLKDLAKDLERRYPAGWCSWANKTTDNLLAGVNLWQNAPNGVTFSGDPQPQPSSALRVGPAA